MTFRRANDLFLNEAIDMSQSCPLWRLMSTFGAICCSYSTFTPLQKC